MWKNFTILSTCFLGVLRWIPLANNINARVVERPRLQKRKGKKRFSEFLLWCSLSVYQLGKIQREKKKLLLLKIKEMGEWDDEATDLWSWGLTVLFQFILFKMIKFEWISLKWVKLLLGAYTKKDRSKRDHVRIWRSLFIMAQIRRITQCVIINAVITRESTVTSFRYPTPSQFHFSLLLTWLFLFSTDPSH